MTDLIPQTIGGRFKICYLPLAQLEFSERLHPLLAGSTYRKLLLDSGQWKIQSLANVSLLA
ncbi:MAG: hypothetical protein PHV02_09455 [Rhodocyclaceae bacterium]|nr:hypothetical protein [Rhodocyclaceae bacterium]